MHDNTLSAGLAPVQDWQEIDALSLYHVFEQITDERHLRGKRYSLALVLSLLILGKLAGMTTLIAIAEWVRWRADWLRQVLPDAREQFPCVATYSNVLRAVDADQFTQVHGLLADAAGGRAPLWCRTQSFTRSTSSTRAAYSGGPRRENVAGNAGPCRPRSAQSASGDPL